MIETTMVARAEQELARQHELASDRLQVRQALFTRGPRPNLNQSAPLVRAARQEGPARAPARRDAHRRRPGAGLAGPAAWALRLRHRLH